MERAAEGASRHRVTEKRREADDGCSGVDREYATWLGFLQFTEKMYK